MSASRASPRSPASGSPDSAPRATVRRSAPAQKWPPEPVRTATRAVASASKARKASARARAVGPSTALRTSGRSIVTTQTSSPRSTRTLVMRLLLASVAQHERDRLVGERVERDARRRARLRSVPRRREIDRPENHQAGQLRVGTEAALAVQLVERRLPDRVVAILQLDDAPLVLRRQRAPVVQHHRDEVAARVVQDAVVGADEAAKALDRSEVLGIEDRPRPLEPQAQPFFHDRHQQLVLVREVIERA